MTSKETFEKALDRAYDAAGTVNDAAKNLYEKAKDLTHDAAENIGEPVNEVAKEQWGKITENFGEADNDGNLILGVFVGVTSILFVYGVCKAVSYFEKPKNEEK